MLSNELIWIKKGEAYLEEAGYLLDDAKARYEVREIDNGYLVLNRQSDIWLKFAVMTFFCSDGDDKNVQLQVQFHGEGPIGNLRECRHTYWGDEGYLFYPDGIAIAAGLKALSEFYDDLSKA